MVQNIERKSRIVIGILAIISVLMFLAFSFGSSNGVLIGMIAVGILAGILVYTEAGIVAYVKQGKYRTFTGGDIMVILGFIIGTAVIIFSVSLIPTIGEIIPDAITSFTATFARIIAVALAIIIGIFIVTPRFE